MQLLRVDDPDQGDALPELHVAAPVRVVHNLEWYPSLENKDDQFIRADFTLRVPIAGHLSAEAAALYSWGNTPATDSKRLDEKYLIGVAYTF